MAYGEGAYGEGVYGGGSPLPYSSEVLADSPLVYWKFDETSGSIAADSSGNGRTLNHAGAQLGQPSLLGDGTGRSAGYTTSGQYSNIGTAAWMDVSTFTIEARLKPVAASLTGDQFIASRWGAGGQRTWLLLVSSGKLTARVAAGGNENLVFSGATTLVAGQTYTVALKYDGSAAKLLLDGQVDGSLAMSGALVTSISTPIDIARAALGVYGVPGYLDEFSYTATALSDARLLTRHQAAASAGPISGTLSVTLPPLSANLSGGIEFTGTISATLPALGANLAGTSLPPGIAGTLSATLPALSADLAGTSTEPSYSGTLDAVLPSLSADLVGQSFQPGLEGYIEALLPALSASLSGDVLGRSGLGLALDSSAVLTVEAPLEPEPTVPPGTPPTVLHVIAPTVPVPTLVNGRPS